MKLEKISYIREDYALVIKGHSIPLDTLKATASLILFVAVIFYAMALGQQNANNYFAVASFLTDRGCEADQVGHSIIWTCPNNTVVLPEGILIKRLKGEK